MVSSSLAQDKIRKANGKVKDLNGEVTYFNDIYLLYQSREQRKEENDYRALSEHEKEVLPISRRLERQIERFDKVNNRRTEIDKKYKIEVRKKEASLSGKKFKKWNDRKQDQINKNKQRYEFNLWLKERLESDQNRINEAKERRRFARRIHRDHVYSIIKPDSAERVIYVLDKLLMTNGRVRNIRKKVVHTDHDEVLYQRTRTQVRMQRYLSDKEISKKKKEFNFRSIQKQKTVEKRSIRKKEKHQTQLVKRNTDFEESIKEKINRLSPSDFEKWKNKELLRIQETGKKQELVKKLSESLEAVNKNRQKLRELGRFTKRIQRSRVFSILKGDGSEIVIYSADTLGFFADGEAEVEYGVAEMRMYIKGRQDGRKHGLHDFWIGAGSSLITSLAMTWYLDAFYAPLFPATTVAIMTLFPIKLNPKLKIGMEERLSAAYMDGYDRSATGRKVMAFSLGSLAGMGIGIGGGLLSAPLLR